MSSLYEHMMYAENGKIEGLGGGGPPPLVFLFTKGWFFLSENMFRDNGKNDSEILTQRTK